MCKIFLKSIYVFHCCDGHTQAFFSIIVNKKMLALFAHPNKCEVMSGGEIVTISARVVEPCIVLRFVNFSQHTLLDILNFKCVVIEFKALSAT